MGFLLVLATGLLVVARAMTCRSTGQDTALLLDQPWRWVSWTEQAGTQAPHERILPCMQDDIIRFGRTADGQNVYQEHFGLLQCEPSAVYNTQGEWELADEGRLLIIRGGASAFENRWQLRELTATSLKLAYRTNISAGPFVMTMAFVRHRKKAM